MSEVGIPGTDLTLLNIPGFILNKGNSKMAKIDTLFASAGICVHSNGSVTVSKVRFGTDFVGRVKLLQKDGNVKHRGTPLNAVRVDLIELPEPMLKSDALNYIQSHEKFQSAEDQALIQEAIQERAPKSVRVRKSKSEISLDSIRARAQEVTATDVLKAVSSDTQPA